MFSPYLTSQHKLKPFLNYTDLDDISSIRQASNEKLTILTNIQQASLIFCKTFLSVMATPWPTSQPESVVVSVNFLSRNPPDPMVLYLWQHSAAITCLSKLCQLCLRLSLPATKVRGLSKRHKLNLDQACHYQAHLRVVCLKLLFAIMW